MVNPPLPSLNLALNAKTAVTIGALSNVSGDVASTGDAGSVVFDISSSQNFFNHALAHAVEVRVGATVGNVRGNDIIVDGFAASQTLGLDPAQLPAIPPASAAVPGATSISVAANRLKQLCAGQYGAVSVGTNATLNLNGGIYEMTRLTLADGAKLQPSEPVILLVAGNVSTGIGSQITPFPSSLNPLSASNIRLEIGGNATIGANSEVRAHLLVPNGRLTTANAARLTGAAWAKTINIGTSNTIAIEGVFSVQPAALPPACNDNSTCTVDACVGGGTASGFCRNTQAPAGTSCADGEACNGTELCDGAGICQPGTTPDPGTSCADGDACNGDETCDGVGRCNDGTPPIVNDNETCTVDACDPDVGVTHIPLPDGSVCSGTGVCEGGVCSVQGATFSESFFFQQDSLPQCDVWNSFRSQLAGRTFNSVTLGGTFDPDGVTCNDPAIATQLCQALSAGTFTSVACNGRIWNVGLCGPGIELSAGLGLCNCGFGYAARPCIGPGNPNWGGANSETCFGPSQNLTVNCQ